MPSIRIFILPTSDVKYFRQFSHSYVRQFSHPYFRPLNNPHVGSIKGIRRKEIFKSSSDTKTTYLKKSETTGDPVEENQIVDKVRVQIFSISNLYS
jgi:hypothetical protein